MTKKGQIDNIMMTIGITAIVAIIAISIFYTTIVESGATSTVTDDQFTASNTSCVRVTDECIKSTTKIENASKGAVLTANYSTCGEGNDVYGYIISNGKGKQFVGVTVNATYVKESCGAIGGMTKTIINYIPIIAGLVLMVFTVGFIRS